MPDLKEPPGVGDRAFWMTVRAALIMVIRAIERRYGLKGWAADDVVENRSVS